MATRPEFSPDVQSSLVEGLINEFVLNADLDTHFHTDYATASRAFVLRSRAYRLATVILVLLARQRRDSRLADVRVAIERQMFGADTKAVRVNAGMVKAAVEDLAELQHILSSGSRRELRWAMSWFEASGIRETNPEALRQFIVHWGLMAKGVSEVVEKVAAVS